MTRPAQQQAAVAAAEAEGVAQDHIDAFSARLAQDEIGPVVFGLMQFSPAGRNSSLSASRLNTISVMPAAPRVWPVQPLVERPAGAARQRPGGWRAPRPGR
jgi:hypothetical protein